MSKFLIAAAVAAFAMTNFTSAYAGGSFGINGGFGSSTSTTGGSQAESGVNGTGYSTQSTYSQGFGKAQGTTGFTSTGFNGNSSSYSDQASGGTSTSTGYTNGGGYGDSKSGVATNTGSYGFGNVSGSYSYQF